MTKGREERIKQLLKEKNYNEILNICKEILDTDKKDYKAYFYKGRVNYDLKQYEEAIKNYDKAIEDYDKVIEFKDKCSIAYFHRGLSKYSLKRYKEAIGDYDKAIEFNKKYSVAFNNSGVAKYYLKRYEEAIEDYDKAIEINKEYSVAYRNRGKSKFYLKRYEEAIKDYDKAIKLKDKDIKNYIFIGACYLFLGKDKKFIENFKRYYESPYRKNSGISYINQIIMLQKNYSDIIKCIEELVNKKYNKLWEEDTIFNIISNLISKETNSKEILNYIKNILLYQYWLLKSLCFNNDKIEISHYTSLNTLFLLLNDKKEEKKNESRIRITNISNANDPKEGKILESIFNKNKNGLNIKIDNDKDLITLQTSFSRNKDSLTMFRLYGKNESKEATGICLVLDKKYFNDEYSSPPFEINNTQELENQNLDDKKEEQIDRGKRNLYWVLYYNEKENVLVFNPNDSKYSNIIINLNLEEKIKEIEEIKNLKDLINYIFHKIMYNAEELDKELDENIKDNVKKEVFSKLFEYIKYLIKDEAFFEEQELRMLVTTNYNSSNIYIPIIKIKDYI